MLRFINSERIVLLLKREVNKRYIIPLLTVSSGKKPFLFQMMQNTPRNHADDLKNDADDFRTFRL